MRSMPNVVVAVSNSYKNKVCLVDLNVKAVVQIMNIQHAGAICYHKHSDTLLVGRCLKRDKNEMLDGSTGVIEQYCPTTGRFLARIFERQNWHVYSSPHELIFANDGVLIIADYYVVRIAKIMLTK